MAHTLSLDLWQLQDLKIHLPLHPMLSAVSRFYTPMHAHDFYDCVSSLPTPSPHKSNCVSTISTWVEVEPDSQMGCSQAWTPDYPVTSALSVVASMLVGSSLFLPHWLWDSAAIPLILHWTLTKRLRSNTLSSRMCTRSSATSEQDSVDSRVKSGLSAVRNNTILACRRRCGFFFKSLTYEFVVSKA